MATLLGSALLWTAGLALECAKEPLKIAGLCSRYQPCPECSPLEGKLSRSLLQTVFGLPDLSGVL